MRIKIPNNKPYIRPLERNYINKVFTELRKTPEYQGLSTQERVDMEMVFHTSVTEEEFLRRAKKLLKIE